MSDAAQPAFEFGTNYFSLFSLPDVFEVDLSALKSEYLKLQQQCHPDKYVSKPEAEQHQAVKLAAYLNQAYDALKSPLKRAIYMLELRQVEFDLDSQIQADTDFLMSQLVLREQLEAAHEANDPFAELDQLLSQAERDYKAYQNEFVGVYANEDWDAAIKSIHKMMFASKLIAEIRLKEEHLES